MASQKPTQPPASDFGGMEDAWLESVKQPDGSDYLVFARRTLTTWKRWVSGEFEFDGKGLRDVVNSNALYLDEVKDDLDEHKEIDKTRHTALAARVSALEAQGEPPFPIA